MNPISRASRFPTRLLTLTRQTFEASVAIHYDAPWTREPAQQIRADDTKTLSRAA